MSFLLQRWLPAAVSSVPNLPPPPADQLLAGQRAYSASCWSREGPGRAEIWPLLKDPLARPRNSRKDTGS